MLVSALHPVERYLISENAYWWPYQSPLKRVFAGHLPPLAGRLFFDPFTPLKDAQGGTG